MMVWYTTKNDMKVPSHLNYDIMTFDTLNYMNCRRIERLLRVQIKEQSYTTVISS